MSTPSYDLIKGYREVSFKHLPLQVRCNFLRASLGEKVSSFNRECVEGSAWKLKRESFITFPHLKSGGKPSWRLKDGEDRSSLFVACWSSGKQTTSGSLHRRNHCDIPLTVPELAFNSIVLKGNWQISESMPGYTRSVELSPAWV